MTLASRIVELHHKVIALEGKLVKESEVSLLDNAINYIKIIGISLATAFLVQYLARRWGELVFVCLYFVVWSLWVYHLQFPDYIWWCLTWYCLPEPGRKVWLVGSTFLQSFVSIVYRWQQAVNEANNPNNLSLTHPIRAKLSYFNSSLVPFSVPTAVILQNYLWDCGRHKIPGNSYDEFWIFRWYI